MTVNLDNCNIVQGFLTSEEFDEYRSNTPEPSLFKKFAVQKIGQLDPNLSMYNQGNKSSMSMSVINAKSDYTGSETSIILK